jgi:hypothetical protein
VVGRDHAEDPLGTVGEVENERDIESDEVAEPHRIEASRRVRKADVDDRAANVGPPRVDGVVGEPEVGGQVADEVEGHRFRGQQLGPESLVIEALVPFDGGRPGSRRIQCRRGEEGRAGLSRESQGKTTPDESRRTSLRSGGDRVRPDRIPVCFAPLRLVVALPPPELRHRRLPWHVIVRLPAVRGLEHFPRQLLGHGEIVRRAVRTRPRV